MRWGESLKRQKKYLIWFWRKSLNREKKVNRSAQTQRMNQLLHLLQCQGIRGKPFWSIHSIINWSYTIPNVLYMEIPSDQAESSAQKSLWMMWDQELMRRLQKLQTRSLKSQERWKGPIWSEAVIIPSFQVWVKLVASGDLVEINLDRDKPARWLALSLKNCDCETQMIWYLVILTGPWMWHLRQPHMCPLTRWKSANLPGGKMVNRSCNGSWPPQEMP